MYAKYSQAVFAANGTYDLKFTVGSLAFANILQCTLNPSTLLPRARTCSSSNERLKSQGQAANHHENSRATTDHRRGCLLTRPADWLPPSATSSDTLAALDKSYWNCLVRAKLRFGRRKAKRKMRCCGQTPAGRGSKLDCS